MPNGRCSRVKFSGLGNPDQSVVVNLLGVPTADRPAHFAGLLTELEALRARVDGRTGLPADEAHYQLPAGWSPAALSLPPVWNGAILVSVHPDHIA
ncbi:MAG: hypothetical protein U0075_08585 [Thermomicrobiales bacterium]